MPIVHPLTIFSILVAGAIVLPQLKTRVSRPARLLLILIIAAVTFLLAVGVFPEAPLAVEISSWTQLHTPNAAISFQVDELAGRFMLLTFFTILAVTVASLDEQWDGPTDDYKPVILAVGAGMLAFVTADNLLSWLVAWILLDLMWLFTVGLPGRSQWALETGVIQGSGFFALFGATVFVWQEHATMTFQFPEQPALPVYLIFGALLLRMGTFPLHVLTRAQEKIPEQVRALTPLVMVGASGYWLLRWTQQWGVAWLPAQTDLVLAAGLAATGLLAWRRRHATEQTAALTAWLALLVLWALWRERPDVAAGTIWTGTLALSVLALYGGEEEAGGGVALLAMLAAVALIGVPGSPLHGIGWLAGAELAGGSSWLAAAGALSLAGVTGGLLHILLAPSRGEYQRSRWTGMLLLSLAAWPALGGLIWLRPDVSAEVALEVPGRVSFGMVALGWAGGVLAWRIRDLIAGGSWVIDRAVDIVNVTWLWHLAAHIVWAVASVIRGVVRVIEGENYGWLLLFLLVALLFLAQ